MALVPSSFLLLLVRHLLLVAMALVLSSFLLLLVRLLLTSSDALVTSSDGTCSVISASASKI